MNMSLGKVHWTELNLKLNWICSANVFAGLDIIRQILFLQKQILTKTRIILKETCQVPATIDIASIGQPANIKNDEDGAYDEDEASEVSSRCVIIIVPLRVSDTADGSFD